MDKIKILNLSEISDIIDNINTSTDWSEGADGSSGEVDSLSYIVIEHIYELLNHRNQTSSIKFFRNVDDALAYEWHEDNSNPTETEITSTALVYLSNCEGSEIEIKDDDSLINYKPQRYDLIVLGANVPHRAKGKKHGPVMKVTFLWVYKN